MAFSSTKSTEKKIDYTSLISGPTLDVQAKYLDQAIADKYIPYEPTMGQFITADEMVARYENFKNWYGERKHMWIGTGPYYVDQVFTTEEIITVSRYEDYLFPADQFSGYGEPMIATATVEGETSIQAGAEAAFDVYVNFNDEAYPSADIEKVAYIVFDANNVAVFQGDAENVGDGVYQVVLTPEMTEKLEAGTAKLAVAVTSKVVSIPAFADAEFVVTK
jgi:peptide/nickel transport system substrate-binding protein